MHPNEEIPALPDEALPPDEPADGYRPGGDATGDDDHDGESNDELVIEIDPAVRESLAKLTQQQSEILRRAIEPITSAWQQQHADWVASVSKSMLAGIDTSALRAIGEAFAAQLPKFELPPIEFPALKTLQLDLARLVGEIDFDAIRRAWLQGRPPNWHDLGDRVKLTKLLEVTEAGLPTAWVPRASVLEELLDTDEADRPAVFAARRTEVVEDCRTVLNDVTSPELADLVDMLGEALDVADGGHLAAAQALAASIFDTALRKTLPQQSGRYYAKAKAEITNRHENASIAEMRWGFVHMPAIVVLDEFWEYKGDPIPTKFNRHATVHAAGRVQYTPANAVIALALATSLVREAHQGIADSSEAAA